MSDAMNQENLPILVEFTSHEDLLPVGFFSRKNQIELAKKSDEAMNRAMVTIQKTAKRVRNAVDEVENKPSHVEVEFGIKFDAEIGVMIAKATLEASMIVRLSWQTQKVEFNPDSN